MSIFNKILDFEDNKLPPEEIKALFSTLIETGQIWQLPPLYVEAAAELIEKGLLTTRSTMLQ